jgi:hypothetical protein
MADVKKDDAELLKPDPQREIELALGGRRESSLPG